MDIGSNLRKARNLKGMSQEELANALNVSRQCISLWETDQTLPTLENMQAISNALGFAISVLMGQMPFPNERSVESPEEKEKRILEKRKADARIFTNLALIFSSISCITFLIPVFGLFIAAIGILFSILAKLKESNLKNTFCLILSCVYFFACIITIVEFL